MVRFLHTADWQLGMSRAFLTDEAQARFSEARLEAVREIGRIAAREQCAFVVVCGDVLESNHLDRRVLLRTLAALNDFTVPVYLLPGNHDPLDASSILASSAFAEAAGQHVAVLDRAGIWPVSDGVQIVAAPWFSKRPLEDLLRGAGQGLQADGSLRIVVGHGAVDVLSPNPDDPALIMTAPLEAALDDGRIHYVALGDRHSRTSVGASGRICYSGAPEPTDFDEVDPGHVLVVEVDAKACSVQPVSVATWRFLQPEPFVLRDADDITRLGEWLQTQPQKERTVARLRVEGALNLRDMATLDALLAHHRELYASVRVWERASDLVLLAEESDFAELGLAGFAADAVDALRAAAADGPEAGVAQDALALLYRLQRSVA